MRFDEYLNKAKQAFAKKFRINPFTGHADSSRTMTPTETVMAGYEMFLAGLYTGLNIEDKEDIPTSEIERIAEAFKIKTPEERT